MAFTSACGPPNSWWYPSPMILSLCTITLPTSGLVLVNPRPFLASSSSFSSVISVSSNIAEGSSRKSGKEQARYTEISYGSLLEILSQLIAANDLEYITDEIITKQRPLIEEIGNKLNKLREVQLKK